MTGASGHLRRSDCSVPECLAIYSMIGSMDECHARSADRVRQRIEAGAHDRLAFRAALLSIPPDVRDAWLDRVLGLGAPPDDGPELPRGCVPYLSCGVDALI